MNAPAATPATQRIAIFAGTFDPITLGHEQLLRRASRLFDQVIVGVAAAHHKKTLFTLDERLAQVRGTLADVRHLRAEPFQGLLMDFARTHGACAVVRGIRGTVDFDYEAQLAGMNRRLAPEVETVLLTPSDETQHISSTLVREIAMLGGAYEQFVSPLVAKQLQARLQPVTVV
jgi:pantetheine-phosphate adenylyltransferase